MIIENNALAPKIADHISLSSWLIPCTDETARAQKKEDRKLRIGKIPFKICITAQYAPVWLWPATLPFTRLFQ